MNGERELVQKIIAGDKTALGEYYRQHVDRLYRFIYQRVGDAQHAEDILQETFMKALEMLPGFQQQSSLYTWLCSIAKNKALDHLKRKRPVSIEMDPQARESSNEVVAEALTSLPEQYQGVLRAKYIEGYSVREIAADMSMSEKAVESMLTRARDSLKQVLEVSYG